MSLTLRDQLIRECWVPADFRTPAPDPRGPHYPVQVWGVVDDPRLAPNNEKRYVFQDIVTWWPSLKIWTVTLQCRTDEDAQDFPCTVLYWQPLPPLPTL